MTKKKFIPNPNLISLEEKKFIETEANNSSYNNIDQKLSNKSRFKKCMITIPEEVYNELNEYLRENLAEGSKSGLIVRIIGEYLKSKNLKN